MKTSAIILQIIFLIFFISSCNTKTKNISKDISTEANEKDIVAEMNKAIEENDIAKVEELLTSNSRYVFNTAVINNGQTDILSVFLEHGLNPNTTSDFTYDDVIYTSWTYLYSAVSAQQLESVKMLLQYGADANIITTKSDGINELNLTPLSLAIMKNLPEYVDILLEAGADPNFILTAENGAKFSLTAFSLMNGYDQILKKLLAAGASPNTSLSFNGFILTTFEFAEVLYKKIRIINIEMLETVLKGGVNSAFFSTGKNFQLDNNAHVFSQSDLKHIYDMKNQDRITRVSAENLYSFYDCLSSEYTGNSLMRTKVKEETKNSLIIISGYVSTVRKSIFSEYIVELDITGRHSTVAVVFPENISSEDINKLLSLRKGDPFESLALTRSDYNYVDVPVWNQNGIYRVEP